MSEIPLFVQRIPWKSLAVYGVAVLVGEATLLKSATDPAHPLPMFELMAKNFLEMIITFGTITGPFISYSPIRTPIGMPLGEAKRKTDQAIAEGADTE